MYQHLSAVYDRLFSLPEGLDAWMGTYVLKNGQAVDLGCGTGRLTKIIHDYDMSVEGIDLDPAMIQQAKKTYPWISFHEQDMIDYLKSSQHGFDLITCFGNTLPHLDPKSLKRFWSLVKLKLSSEGWLIIQLLNYESILKKRPASLPTLTDGSMHLKRSYTYRKDTILFTTTIETKNTSQSDSVILYPYTKGDLITDVQAIGMTVKTYGDLKMKPCEPEDSHIYLLIRHP